MQEAMLRAGTKSHILRLSMPNGRPKEIKTHTTKDMQNHSEDMMKKTRGAIDSQLEELDVHLDVRLGAGPLYMETDVFWKYLWVFAEHKISELKLAAEAKSAESRNGHQTRADAIDEMDWEEGGEFKDRYENHRAKISVLSALEKSTQKQIGKAEDILSSIVSDLREKGLQEEYVLSAETRKMLATTKAMVNSVSSLITQMTKKMTSQSTRLLTGLCAMLAPQQESDVFSFRDLSNILGINRCAKYLQDQDGLRNREAYDNFLAFDGPILPGERVVCRGGDDGELVAMDGNSITIKLHPFGTKVTYPSARAARMRRYEPRLDLYERDERCDETSDHIIDIIDAFWRRHVPMSPNKFDTVKKRHPLYPAQYEEKQAMLRSATNDEMEHCHRQSKIINFCSILDSRCSRCLEIPILWQEVDQDLTDSDERRQLHLPVWESMLDQGKTIKAVTRVGTTGNTVLYGR